MFSRECAWCGTPLGTPLVDDKVINTPYCGWDEDWRVDPVSAACVACIHKSSLWAMDSLQTYEDFGDVVYYTIGARYWERNLWVPACDSPAGPLGRTVTTLYVPPGDDIMSREDLVIALESVTQWRFAASYKEDRHDYSMKHHWVSVSLFERLLDSLYAYAEPFWYKPSYAPTARKYQVFIANYWRYWSMGPTYRVLNRTISPAMQGTLLEV